MVEALYDLDHMEPCHNRLPPELSTLLPHALHDLCEPQRVDRGARLFETGRRPAAMYFVASGEVVLQRMGEDGGIMVLQRTRHGFVGEASLQSERYHCDAVVVAKADVTRIPRQALLDALRSDAGFALRWIAMLNQEVRRLRQQSERLSLNTVEARLLHLVRTEGGGSGLPLGSGLKTLAREIGVTHEALYRCAARLEREGVLVRADGWLRMQASMTRETAFERRDRAAAHNRN
jgi:CRP/FNR family transcriptional regulator, dissimilatory nitrate respiration regulator